MYIFMVMDTQTAIFICVVKTATGVWNIKTVKYDLSTILIIKLNERFINGKCSVLYYRMFFL